MDSSAVVAVLTFDLLAECSLVKVSQKKRALKPLACLYPATVQH